jgi:hypothetical protein
LPSIEVLASLAARVIIASDADATNTPKENAMNRIGTMATAACAALMVGVGEVLSICVRDA